MNKHNVVLVGGGSTWTPGILKGFTRHQDIFPLEKITMYDIDEERQKVIGEFGKILFAEEEPKTDFSYTTDKTDLYKDVDFVFCQMRVGGYPMREKDEKIPLQYGVIGNETCGPGGYSYAMRSIHDMIEMVKDVRKEAPNAWILNYTNPAALVSLALSKAFPDDHRILTMCDQPANELVSFGALLGRDSSLWEPHYFGLNHFGWFTHMYDENGIDIQPEIKEYILKNGFRPVDYEQRDQSWLDSYAMVKNLLEDTSDYLPNTYLQYYFYPEYKASKLNPNYTRANEVMDGREKKVFAECRRIAANGTAKDSHVVHNDVHGSYIINVAASIANNSHKGYVVIVPNKGIIPNLPNDVQIEVACSLGNTGARPFAFGAIDTFYKAMIENQHASESLWVEAYFEGSYSKALQALTLNRTVNDAMKARKILDALIEANKDYWPELR